MATYEGMTRAQIVKAAAGYMPSGPRLTPTSTASELWKWYSYVNPRFGDDHMLARTLPPGMFPQGPQPKIVTAEDLWRKIAKAVKSRHESSQRTKADAPKKKRSRARSRGVNTTGPVIDPSKIGHASVSYRNADGYHKGVVPFRGGTWAGARAAIRKALKGAKIEWDTLQIG